MKARELANLGIPRGDAMKLAQRLIGEAAKSGLDGSTLRAEVRALAADPAAFTEHAHWAALAAELLSAEAARLRYIERETPAPWRQWGSDLEEGAVTQMANACRLPISMRGALMPDAHQGYGLPIGGVLATRGAVVPYAVGVDIACRMKLTVLDLPVETLRDRMDWLTRTLNEETRFGIGAHFTGPKRREHAVLDADWTVSPVTRENKDKAWAQLGTSGSGNHFVEFGTLTLAHDDLGLESGTYLALLSHSGSRGTGGNVADYYSKLAMSLHPGLPKDLHHLAWLDLDSEPGQEYWQAMELMGRYAAANHELIHRHVAAHLGVEVLLDIENHHNFAWREVHDGEEVIVHRKGATPAGAGILGIIPGSMGTPGYVVRGRGEEASLNSASHGAGRRMSRTAAIQRFTWRDIQDFLRARGVTLLSAGIDEAPMAYKDIETVMSAQRDLVRPVARFEPKLVKMAPAGERPED